MCTAFHYKTYFKQFLNCVLLFTQNIPERPHLKTKQEQSYLMLRDYKTVSFKNMKILMVNL